MRALRMCKSTKCAKFFFVASFLGVSSYVMYKSLDQLRNEELNNSYFALLEFVIFHVLVQ